MSNEKFVYTNPNHGANLNGMRLSGKLCDVTLKVGDREIRAHKVVLAANLKYFELMFSDKFQESKKDVVRMKDVDGCNLEAFISYAYTGEMMGDQKQRIGFARSRRLPQRRYRAFRALNVANAIECLSLKITAKSKILMSFETSSRSIEYLSMDFESFKDVMRDANFYNVESLPLIFEGIMRWIIHDPKDRKIHVGDVLHLMDITRLSTSYLMDYLGDMVEQNVDDHGIVKDLISYHHRCKKAKSLGTVTPKHLVLVGYHLSKFHVLIYNFEKKMWFHKKKVVRDINDIIHFYHNSAVLHDQIYCVTQNYYKTCDFGIFDHTDLRSEILHSWDILKESAICACNEYIYLCGGSEKVRGVSSSSNKCLRYDPQTNRIETLMPMKTKRQFAAAIFDQGHLIVLGGDNDHRILESVEKYNFATKEWTALRSMISPRADHAVAVLNGKIYACGGGLKSVEVYDPIKNKWKLVASMNKKRWWFLVVAHERKLWAIGGYAEKTVEVYDPSENQWQMDHEMSSGLKMSGLTGGLVSANCIKDASGPRYFELLDD